MKAVILAGGLGTRLSEETHLRPKPMVEIGGMPIIWHIMKIYSFYGINDFILSVGYKGDIIKEYFFNYLRHASDITINMPSNEVIFHQKRAEPWRVTIVDTGSDTQTGGRILGVRDFLEADKIFCCTYGDGVSDVNIKSLISFHLSHQKLVTMTVAYPPARFGAVEMNGEKIENFNEKPINEGGFINAGFFVINKNAINYISDLMSVWEREPLKKLARDGQLMAYKHTGFWKPMDTLRDKRELNDAWNEGRAKWKSW